MSGSPGNRRSVTVRLEADAGPLRPGEVRLLEPLSNVEPSSASMTLPAVDADIGEAAIQSIFDLHRELADSNSDPTWWYLPVAEWQPNMSVLPAALDLAARLETLVRLREGRFVLTVAQPLVARYLEAYFAGRSDVQIVADRTTRVRWALRGVKAAVLRYVNAALWLVDNARIVLAVRRARARPALPARVHTLFVSRIEAGFAPPADGVWRDAYLGALPEEGRARTGSVALLLRNGGDPARQARAVAGFAAFPVILVVELLSLSDLWHCLRRALRLRLAVSARPGPLARVALAESRGHVRAVADWVAVERAASSLLGFMTVGQVVGMQENSGWELAIASAASRADQMTKTFGFFHCPVMPAAQRYRIRGDVLERRPNFDKTITLGPAMRQALLRLGDWTPSLSAEHYAFRNPDLAACLALPVRMPGTLLRLLVVLGGVFDNGRFLAWIRAAIAPISDVVVVIKPHPSFDHRPALAQAGIDLADGRFVLSPHRKMDLALGEADVLIYKGTTVCFAALAAGVPVIHVNDGGVASDDVLFDAGGLAVSIGDAAALVREIEKIRAQTRSSREAWVSRARSYVREYYDLSAESRVAVLDALFAVPAPGRAFDRHRFRRNGVSS